MLLWRIMLKRLLCLWNHSDAKFSLCTSSVVLVQLHPLLSHAVLTHPTALPACTCAFLAQPAATYTYYHTQPTSSSPATCPPWAVLGPCSTPTAAP